MIETLQWVMGGCASAVRAAEWVGEWLNMVGEWLSGCVGGDFYR